MDSLCHVTDIFESFIIKSAGRDDFKKKQQTSMLYLILNSDMASYWKHMALIFVLVFIFISDQQREWRESERSEWQVSNVSSDLLLFLLFSITSFAQRIYSLATTDLQ